MSELPILYTFRRCPYAIRARMTLSYARIRVEHREVVLADKPQAMLQASAKGTVPVLVLPDGRVLDESLDVMDWALAQNDPDTWMTNKKNPETQRFIETNDGPFKHCLDRYKYADRYPERSATDYLHETLPHLSELDAALAQQRFLAGDTPAYGDVAIFPFIRQLAAVDRDAFEALGLKKLSAWLDYFLQSGIFLGVMEKRPRWTPQQGDVA